MTEGSPVFVGTRTQAGVAKHLLAEEVYERVGALIVDGTLPPGSRIRDAELAEQFRVSRMPIREALQRLERIGLVEMYPSRFTQVTEVSPELATKTLEFAGFVSGAIAALAVPRLTAAEREDAGALADAMGEAWEARSRISPADAIGEAWAAPSRITATRWAFIDYLSARSENPIFRTMLKEARMLVVRNLGSWSLDAEDRERLGPLHAHLGDAVRNGDGPSAERLVRALYLIG